MINESKKGNPQMWKKWSESGAIGNIESALEREEGFKRAHLEIDPPDSFQNNYKISFQSTGRDSRWKAAYANAILTITQEKGWHPFFQTGSQLETANWHSIELWYRWNDPVLREMLGSDKYPKDGVNPEEEIRSIFEVVHQAVRQQIGKPKKGASRRLIQRFV